MPFRIGVIGTGSVVREIYQYLYFSSEWSADLSVEAICDSSDAALTEFGDRHGIPVSRRFSDYQEMIEKVELDAVAVNTPDSLHADPVIAALEAGLEVVVAKPTADRVEDAHRMIEAAVRTGRFLGVDFHKREDPALREARARVSDGVYGAIQSATFHMLDRLMVADPNHQPRFFSSADFAHRNSPVTFLTSHMADSFISITGLRPLEVRATGYKQKLRTLRPIAVDGYDLVDTSVLFEGGVSVQIVTGWALPNTADCLTVQSGRIIGSDGMLDLWEDHYGFHEVTKDAIEQRNVLFRTFDANGMVSGYGIDSPGKLFRAAARHRAGTLSDEEATRLRSPAVLGFYTTLVCECASASLAAGSEWDNGAVIGEAIDARALSTGRIGSAASEYYR